MQRKTAFGVVLLALACVFPLRAQDDPQDKRKPRPVPDCLDGSVYDDRSLENGLRPTLYPDNFVMLVEAPSYPAKLKKVCIAWRRTSFWTGIYFDLRVWAADGEEGAPGTLLGVIPVLYAGKVPTKAKFYSYDVSWADVTVEGPVYIGPYWDPLDYFLIYLAMDTSSHTARQRAFHAVGIADDHAPNVEIGTTLEQAPSYRAFGIRAVFTAP